MLASLLSLYLYIRWSLYATAYFQDFVVRNGLNKDQLFQTTSWPIIITLSILIAIFGLGLSIIFIYYQRTIQLYRLQQSFIDNFTHELKTPISSIRLFLETLQKYDLEKEKRDTYLGYMLADIERLNDSVSNILKVSQLESQKHIYKKEKLDLVTFLTDLIKAHEHSFENLDITFSDPLPPPTYFEFNSQLFEMIFLNLFSNASKYNDSDHAFIKIRIIQKKNTLTIEVTDNGIGIAKANRKKVFEKFYQADRSRKIARKGTGIGLYVVKSIVEMHHGKIQVNPSAAGVGSTFSITLPSSTSHIKQQVGL